MRVYVLLSLCFLVSILATSCTTTPVALALYQTLKPGEAQFIVTMDGEPFYKEDSRFRGEVTVTPVSARLNLFDQYESNTIITLSGSDLFAKRPIVRAISLDNQSLGSIMIGRVRDKVQRTGDGFFMTDGTLTIDHLSEEKIVIRLSGKTGNFNTMNDASTWKRLECLLVYRKPTITVPSGNKKTLFY